MSSALCQSRERALSFCCRFLHLQGRLIPTARRALLYRFSVIPTLANVAATLSPMPGGLQYWTKPQEQCTGNLRTLTRMPQPAHFHLVKRASWAAFIAEVLVVMELAAKSQCMCSFTKHRVVWTIPLIKIPVLHMRRKARTRQPYPDKPLSIICRRRHFITKLAEYI